MPSAIPRRLAAVLGRAHASVLQILLRQRRRLFQVHAAVIDRWRTGGRTRILHEEDGPAGCRVHFMLEMRVGHIGYGAGTVELSGKRELALDDVPDLSEVVPVRRKLRARRVFQKSRIRLRRAFRARVKPEFGDIAKSSHFPFQVGGVLELGWVMRSALTHVAFSRFCTRPRVERAGSPRRCTSVMRSASCPNQFRMGRSSAAPTACGGTSMCHPPARKSRDRYRRATPPDSRRPACTETDTSGLTPDRLRSRYGRSDCNGSRRRRYSTRLGKSCGSPPAPRNSRARGSPKPRPSVNKLAIPSASYWL